MESTSLLHGEQSTGSCTALQGVESRSYTLRPWWCSTCSTVARFGRSLRLTTFPEIDERGGQEVRLCDTAPSAAHGEDVRLSSAGSDSAAARDREVASPGEAGAAEERAAGADGDEDDFWERAEPHDLDCHYNKYFCHAPSIPHPIPPAAHTSHAIACEYLLGASWMYNHVL